MPELPRVFVERTRTDREPKRIEETPYSFLNRSARPGDEKTRSLIETWVADLSDAEWVFLCPRFKSRSARSYIDFTTAFQELFLHQLLLRLGCEVACQPPVDGRMEVPDFAVSQPNCEKFLLEACTSFKDPNGPVRDARNEVARDFLGRLDIGDVRLSIRELTPGTGSLPQNALKRHILKALDCDSNELKSEIPIPDFTQHGWLIRLMGHKVESDGTSGSILCEVWGRTWSGPDFSLKDRLKEKGKRYGKDLPVPLVVALNSVNTSHSEVDFYDTLFGAPQDSYIDGQPPNNRLSRGYWGAAENPKHQQVSAVLFTLNVRPETVLMGRVQPCFYLNPWATHSYEGILTTLRTARLVDGVIRFSGGTSLNKILNVAVEPSDLW